MPYSKEQQAADIAADLLKLHHLDRDKLVLELSNSSTFYAKMSVIDKLCADYENDQYTPLIATYCYKATPKQIKHARLTMLYTLLPKLSEIDMINLKSAYGMRKGQKIIDDIENTFISNIYTLWPDLAKRETLMRVINNIHAKDMIFGMYLNHVGQFTNNSTPWIRTVLKSISSDKFIYRMNIDSNGQWNYIDEDINTEVIELFVRRLMSFTL